MRYNLPPRERMQRSSCKGAFGLWLFDQMAVSNLTLVEFSKTIGLHFSLVYYHMIGRFHPSRKSIRKYAKAFDVPIQYIYDLLEDVDNG